MAAEVGTAAGLSYIASRYGQAVGGVEVSAQLFGIATGLATATGVIVGAHGSNRARRHAGLDVRAGSAGPSYRLWSSAPSFVAPTLAGAVAIAASSLGFDDAASAGLGITATVVGTELAGRLRLAVAAIRRGPGELAGARNDNVIEEKEAAINNVAVLLALGVPGADVGGAGIGKTNAHITKRTTEEAAVAAECADIASVRRMMRTTSEAVSETASILRQALQQLRRSGLYFRDAAWETTRVEPAVQVETLLRHAASTVEDVLLVMSAVRGDIEQYDGSL
jgi:hypothetical protein